ncbi:hypothetical protein A5788_06820 [Gordonia sp. 852002-50816_SCH5313054-c]|nr:hypothetical protein A5785_00940 [Gordonia sp. 852002-50395_SCH5434458]OBC16517.1 hypothetical protein A5786_19635 [Gordonia sp. 852002-50816_SCH5313054-a]OBC20352.1 hypothetical protein A5788_06820 [Gordonia sp. 852002-50816_SCH5313054-c]
MINEMSHAEGSQPSSWPKSDSHEDDESRLDAPVGAGQHPSDAPQPPQAQFAPPAAQVNWYTGRSGETPQTPAPPVAQYLPPDQHFEPQQPSPAPAAPNPTAPGTSYPNAPAQQPTPPWPHHPEPGQYGGLYVGGAQQPGMHPGAQFPGGPGAGNPNQQAAIPFSARGTGWRRALSTVSGGLINLGQSKSQQQLDEMVARIRRPMAGDFRLAVLSLKGGVGKTTTTIGLGSAFASLRGDRVIAVDANPDFGTLGRRVPQQTGSTVRSLLNDPNVTRYGDVRRHTSQSASRLEVLASERDPAVSESFSADDYLDVIGILENYYNIIMTDCGTGLLHSAMEGVLSSATAIVLVTSPAVDGAESAAATLDWLNAHGYQRLVQQAVVVISASKPGGAPIDLDMLTQRFLGRTRAVQIIPFDDHLATGAQIDLDQMNRDTRNAFLELAATVSDSFNPGMPPAGAGIPGFQGPPPGYQAPPPGYQAPPPGYQAPPAGYQAPPPGFQGTPPGYQAPPAGYQGPPPGYQPPAGAQGYPTGESTTPPQPYPAAAQSHYEPAPPGSIPQADERF